MSAVTKIMEPYDTRLRPAAQVDAIKIADLEMLLFPENSWNERTIYNQLESGLSWVAERSDEIVGYALVQWSDGIADLLRLGVREGDRRRGLARQLMELALGTRPAMLLVRPGNPAIHLYRQQGFRVVGVVDGSWLMRRS